LLIEKCEEDLSFGKGAFFLHQYRGMKATTTHNPNNEEEARNALKDLFQDMHISMLEDAKWWVDVGMEVHVPGKAVLWRVDSHFALIQHFLDADEATAARNVKEGQCYCVDLTAHLTALGGFRLRPTKVGTFGHRVAYVQAYTTDKALTYHPDGKTHAKNITMKEAIRPNSEGSIPYVEQVYHAYSSALEKKLTAASRIEMRVELQYAQADLHMFSPALIKDTVVCIPRRVWWTFKLMRATAAGLLLKWQNEGPKSLRKEKNALGLTLALVHLLNALNNRPYAGQGIPELYRFILPLTYYAMPPERVRIYADEPTILPEPEREGEEEEEEEDEDEDEGNDDEVVEVDPEVIQFADDGSVPIVANGLFFIRAPIRLADKAAPVPRLSNTRAKIGWDVVEKLSEARKDTIFAMIDKTQPPGEVRRGWGASNKKFARGWMRNMDEGDQPEPSRFNHINPANYPAVRLTQHDGGSDMGTDDEDEDEPDIKELLNTIWRSMLINVAYKCVTRRNGDKWIKFPHGGSAAVKEEFYSTLDVSSRLQGFRYVASDYRQWDDNFHRMFPTDPNHKMYGEKKQGWGQVSWIKDWRRLVQDWPTDKIEKVKRQIKKQFDNLSWMVMTRSDRLWDSREDGAAKSMKLVARGEMRKNAPHVIINPKYRAKDVK
ncbi:hypothetical protein BD410DRAFT_810629, partial [Rickenella mellea]